MGFGNGFVVLPKEGRTAREVEIAAQGCIVADAQQIFDVALGEVHDSKSRTLDLGLSSGLAAFRASLSRPMDTMAERLSHALHERHMTPPDLIAATHQGGRKRLSKATIYFILNGTTKPEKIRAGTVETICRIMRIRREWLLWGAPPMNADNGKTQSQGTQAATADDLHEVRVAVSLTAKALAASIRPAGSALLDALEASKESLAPGTFLGELVKALRAETGLKAASRPSSPAKPSKARR